MNQTEGGSLTDRLESMAEVQAFVLAYTLLAKLVYHLHGWE